MNYKTHPVLSLIGHTYGNLVVIRQVPNGHGKRVQWLCLCKCGKQSIKSGSDLRRKGRDVAGCSIRCPLVGTRISRNKTTHGMSKHKAFYSYNNMLARCYNPKNHKWESYGGRGITVCPRWLQSFENFWEDMGPSYIHGLTLHRKNNNGNYSPRNCCWANLTTQARNRRDTVNPDGAPANFREIALAKGIKIATFYRRIATGRSWEQVISKPYQFRKPTNPMLDPMLK